MRRRTIALAVAGLMAAIALLTATAAYTATALPDQVHHNLEIPLSRYGRLWIFINPCTPYEPGTVAVQFQRPVHPPRTHSPDAGSYTIVQREMEESFTPLGSLTTAPRCQ